MAIDDLGVLDMHLRRRHYSERQARTRPPLPRNLRQLGALGPVVKAGGPGQRSAVVRVLTTGAAYTRQELRYLQWRKGHQQSHAPLYGPGAVDPRAFIQRAKEDPHQFRMFVSTKDDALGEQRTQFIHLLMRQMERDLGRPLDWVAANHYDREHPHTHVVIRGVVQGEALYMAKHYVERGIRARAEQLLTHMLGRVQQQSVHEQQRQSWGREVTLSNGLVRGGPDADVYRLKREQMQQTQAQQMAGQLGSYRHEHGVDALRADLARLQQLQSQHTHQAQQMQQRQQRR
jgi:hypothetical protein